MNENSKRWRTPLSTHAVFSWLLFGWMAAMLRVVAGGYIDVMDYEIDYTNISDLTEIKFVFQLESGLSADSFLRLTFPTQMYTTAITAVKVKYAFQGENSCSPMQKFPATIILDGASTTDYLINFQNDISQNIALKAKPYWYALYFYPETGVVLTAGIQKPILAQTQSIDSVPSNYGLPIVYDITNTFAVLEFDVAPTASLVVSNIVSSVHLPYQHMVGRSYEVSFVVAPTVNIAYNARIMFLINKDQRFKYIGMCVSEDHVVASVLISAALTSSQYSCAVDSDKNRIIVTLTQPMVAGKVYRFRTAVLNPGHVTISNGDFEIRTLMGGSNRIIERAIIVGPLYTTILSATQKVMMGNGIDLSSPIYMLNAAVLAGNYFFNPFQFQFTPSLQTPDKVELLVLFKLKIDMTNDKILTGSIQHNFPRYDVTIPVSCVLDNQTTYYQIKCQNVGPLSSAKEYHATARVYFNAAGTLDSYFGSVSVFSVDTANSNALVSMIPITVMTFGSNLIVTNQNRVDTSASTYGYQMVHTQTSYTASGSANPLIGITSLTAGVIACKDTTIKQKLVVTFAAGSFAQFGAGPDIAISMITTPLIKAAPGATGTMFYVESMNGWCSTSTEFPTDSSRMITTSDTQTLVLLASTGNSCLQQGGGTTTFSIGDVYVQNYSGGYAGRDSFDVYGAMFSNYVTGLSPTTYFGVNSYTTSRTGSTCATTSLQYINVGLSNYQTTTGGQTQLTDGTLYPAFIRVTGYLTDEEKANVQRIVVFFNNVDFYARSVDSYGQQKASCSSSMTTDQQCWGYSGLIDESQSVFSMKRVEFDVSPYIAQTGSSSPFQLLIPIKSIPLKNIQRVFVATMKRNPNYGQLTQAFVLAATYPAYRIITGSNAPIYTPLFDLSYNLDVTARTQGAQESADLAISHTSSVPNILQNDPATNPLKIGSAFVIVGDWQMYSNSLAVTSTGIVNTNIRSEGCLSFSYKVTTKRYGIFCPFTLISAVQMIDTNSKVTFSNFVFPALGSLKLSNTYITWSQNTGQLISALVDPNPATATLQANLISNVKDVVLRRYVKDNRVEWLFTTSNPIPADGIISIKLDDTTSTWAFTVMVGNFGRCIMYKQTGTFAEKACTISTDYPNVLILFTFAATAAMPAGDYKLVQYGIESPNTSVSAVYSITIRTMTSGGSIIDKSTSTKTLSYLNTATINSKVSIDSYAFSHYLTPASVGNFKMDFTLDQRPLLALSSPNPGAGLVAGQYIELEIQQLLGQESTMTQCQVLQKGAVYFGFKSIDTASASSIKLFPRDDILTESSQFTFQCLNVINNFSGTAKYRGTILYMGGTLTSITGQVIPTGALNPAYNTIVPISTVGIQKFNGLAGALHHLKFTITLASNGITKDSSFFFTFPIKYSSNAGSPTMSCKINTYTAYCINFSERKIQVSASPILIAAGTSFTIEIFGVSAPLSSATNGSIQVSFSTTHLAKDVVEQYSFIDSNTLADTVPTLTVTYATQTNYISRQLSVYQFNGQCVNSIPSGGFIQLEFPREFGTSITVIPPTSCLTTNAAGGTTYSSTFQIFGKNILIPITTAIPANVEFMIKITSLLTPEDSECKITKLIMSSLAANRLTISARSSVASSNQPLIRSAFDDSLSYINWYSAASTQIKYNKHYVEINAGSYSESIGLIDISDAFHKYITFSLGTVTDATFSIISDEKIYPGQVEERLRIGCPSDTIPGFFTLIFTKVEAGSTQLYGDFSLINVKVNSNQHTIVPEFLTYNVFAGGYSVPIIFDLTEMIPYEDVSIILTTAVLGTDPKIDLVDEAGYVVPQIILNFSPTSYKGKIRARSQIFSTALPTDNSKLTITIFGVDQNAYKSSTTNIVLQLISIFPIPSLSYTQFIDQVSPKATKQTIQITSNLPIAIYYHIRISGGPSRSLSEVRSLIDQYVVLNPMDYFQEQFGQLNYQTTLNAATSYWISNLRSKLDYTITTWTVDALQRIGTAIDFTFSTKNNNGRVLRLPFNFATEPTAAQKVTLGCFMCQKFAIPCPNVISFDNNYCSSLSEYQISITDSVNTNVQRRRLSEELSVERIEQQEVGVISSSLADSLMMMQENNHQRALSTTYTVNFYAISIDEFESDLSWNTIIKLVLSSGFPAMIAAYDSTLPIVQSVSAPTEIVKTSAPSFTDMVTIEKGTTWISVDSIQTNSRSLIWFYLVDYSKGGTPTQQQMKYMLTSQNKTTTTYQIQLFDTVTSSSYNFTGLLPETQYALYYMATTENPSLFAPVSKVAFVGGMTEAEYTDDVTFGNRLSLAIFVVLTALFL